MPRHAPTLYHIARRSIGRPHTVAARHCIKAASSRSSLQPRTPHVTPPPPPPPFNWPPAPLVKKATSNQGPPPLQTLAAASAMAVAVASLALLMARELVEMMICTVLATPWSTAAAAAAALPLLRSSGLTVPPEPLLIASATAVADAPCSHRRKWGTGAILVAGGGRL